MVLEQLDLLHPVYWSSYVISVFESSSAANVLAFLSLMVSLLALRKNVTWKSKFKESAMGDAYKLILDLSREMKGVANVLDKFTGHWIPSFDITHHLGARSSYHTDARMKKFVRGSLKKSKECEVVLLDMRFRIGSIRGQLKGLGYSMSWINERRLNSALNKIMHLEAAISSYESSSFDYFDDAELCTGMRYTKHCLFDNEDVFGSLKVRISELCEDIRSLAGESEVLLRKLRFDKGLHGLYKNK